MPHISAEFAPGWAMFHPKVGVLFGAFIWRRNNNLALGSVIDGRFHVPDECYRPTGSDIEATPTCKTVDLILLPDDLVHDSYVERPMLISTQTIR